ncbi:MAG: hypothetical protein IBX55_17860 [Methyloprofundus sp.]|nr:hypothetical protein [Methyloprofundus sp.]
MSAKKNLMVGFQFIIMLVKMVFILGFHLLAISYNLLIAIGQIFVAVIRWETKPFNPYRGE